MEKYQIKEFHPDACQEEKQVWHYQPTTEIIEKMMILYPNYKITAFKDRFFDWKGFLMKQKHYIFSRTPVSFYDKNQNERWFLKRGNSKVQDGFLRIKQIFEMWTHRVTFKEGVYLDFSTWETEDRTIFFPVLTTEYPIDYVSEALKSELPLLPSPSKTVAAISDILNFVHEDDMHVCSNRVKEYHFECNCNNPFEELCYEKVFGVLF